MLDECYQVWQNGTELWKWVDLHNEGKQFAESNKNNVIRKTTFKRPQSEIDKPSWSWRQIKYFGDICRTVKTIIQKWKKCGEIVTCCLQKFEMFGEKNTGSH